jgi:hypothetical protein
MGFEVEVTDEFVAWYLGLSEDEQLAIDVRVDLLAEEGPRLKRPVVGEVVGSKFDPQMKELRSSVVGPSYGCSLCSTLAAQRSS